MIQTSDWLGRPLELAESKGGVLAFVDALAGLVRGGANPWPTPAVVQKLYRSRAERAFSGADHEAVTSALGFYSDLQSVHSEDAITWSVFGPVAHAQPEVKARYVDELLKAAHVEAAPGPATISLWRRIPHPETLVSGGPELDTIIQTPHAVVFVEAKWRSSLGTGQGRNKDRDQVGLRVEFFEKYGSRLFPGVDTFVVLGASWRDPVITDGHRATLGSTVLLRELTWQRLCSLRSHPVREELALYCAWKVQHTKGA